MLTWSFYTNVDDWLCGRHLRNGHVSSGVSCMCGDCSSRWCGLAISIQTRERGLSYEENADWTKTVGTFAEIEERFAFTSSFWYLVFLLMRVVYRAYNCRFNYFKSTSMVDETSGSSFTRVSSIKSARLRFLYGKNSWSCFLSSYW